MPSKMDNLLTRLGVPESDRYFKNACELAQTERAVGDDEIVLFPRIK